LLGPWSRKILRLYITTIVLVFGPWSRKILRLYITTTVLVVGAVEPQDIAALLPTTHYPLPTTHYPLTPPTTHKPKPTTRKLAVQNTPPSMEFIYFCGLPEPKIGIVLGMIV